jgi:hypothetical protein
MLLRRRVLKALFPSFMQEIIECRGRVESNFSLYFTKAGLKFSPGEWLAFPISSLFSTRYPGNCWDTNQNYTTAALFHFLTNLSDDTY